MMGEVTIANVKHTCQPRELKRKGRVLIDQDGSEHRSRVTAYDGDVLASALRRSITKRGKRMCHAAATQELKRFIHIAKSDERPLEVLATKVLNLLRDEDRFDPDWSLRYAAAYASALSELGHHADILCTTALGYYARQTRKAVAAHEGQQKKLDVKDRVASFNWDFRQEIPAA